MSGPAAPSRKQDEPAEVPTTFWRPTLASAAAVMLVALPAFLVGAFAPAIKEDLRIGDTEIGAIFTVGYLVSALVLQSGGALADVRGPRLAIRLGLMFSVVGLLLIATTATNITLLLVFFAVCRVAEAIVQPATNSLVSRAVIPTRRGTATGIKQAAVPLATMLAGLSVPVLGGTLGWRWTIGVCAVVALPVWFAVPAVASLPARTRRSKADLWAERHLKLAAIAGGFAAAAVVTASGFLVLAAKEAGFSDGRAGLLLAVGGAIMIPARLSWGILADRYAFDRFLAVAVCLSGALVSFLLFATENRAAIVVGTVLLFGVGWSWPGLFLFAVLSEHPEAPGASTALVQTGIRVGAFGSPLFFGWVAETRGYATAWFLPAFCAAIASLLLVRVSRALKAR